MKRLLSWIGIVILVAVLVLVAFNWNSLDDGVLYLQDMLAYTETPAQPLAQDGRFGFCHQFVSLRNAQRAQFIERFETLATPVDGGYALDQENRVKIFRKH
jgi:hypothetical protein